MDKMERFNFDALFSYQLNKPNLINSKSQLRQDIFVANLLNFKKNGYFVEFGATDGIEFSNSYLFSMHYDWKGILSEPNKSYRESLKKNRKNCNLNFDAVWVSDGDFINFHECESGTLSTLEGFNNYDQYSELRKNSKVYKVKTITLESLLRLFNAPKCIDYLSIDTEGSEYDILKSFDFDQYNIKVITCEHNFTSNRKKIKELLNYCDFINVLPGLSNFDDWYINKNFIDEMNISFLDL